MFFCSITPVKNARLMYNRPYVMLLAHLSQKYRKYSDLAANNETSYKIMDNSIIELGSAFNMDSLINEAVRCCVDEIILPDVFEDGKATVKKVKESIKWLKKNKWLGKFKLMAVCHGKNRKEFLKTWNDLNKIKEVDVIGIPKVLNKWTDRRNAITNVETKKEIHFLGCWESLKEIIDIPHNVRSVDTCLPSLLSIKNKEFLEGRNGETINLEEERVNKKNYSKIMKELYLRRIW